MEGDGEKESPLLRIDPGWYVVQAAVQVTSCSKEPV